MLENFHPLVLVLAALAQQSDMLESSHPLVLVLAALAQQSDMLESSLAEEEARISATKQKLSVVTITLIAWAVVVTLAIVVMSTVLFTRMRRAPSGNRHG